MADTLEKTGETKDGRRLTKGLSVNCGEHVHTHAAYARLCYHRATGYCKQTPAKHSHTHTRVHTNTHIHKHTQQSSFSPNLHLILHTSFVTENWIHATASTELWCWEHCKAGYHDKHGWKKGAARAQNWVWSFIFLTYKTAE